MMNTKNKLKANNNKTSRSLGFTLIELIVVIAIVAILSGTVMFTLNPTELLRKSRDSKRLEDLETLSKALQIALLEEEITLLACPVASCNSIEGSIAVSGSGYVSFTVTGSDGLAKYISALPVDPLNSTVNTVVYQYEYEADPTENTFELNARLESADNAPKLTLDNGDNPNVYEIGTYPGLTLLN